MNNASPNTSEGKSFKWMITLLGLVVGILALFVATTISLRMMDYSSFAKDINTGGGTLSKCLAMLGDPKSVYIQHAPVPLLFDEMDSYLSQPVIKIKYETWWDTMRIFIIADFDEIKVLNSLSAQDIDHLTLRELYESREFGRVERWRGGLGRSWFSLLARPFVCECHNISTMLRFHTPAHRTGRADFPHPALRLASFTSTRRLCLISVVTPKTSPSSLAGKVLSVTA
jgi:hypothetical protein